MMEISMYVCQVIEFGQLQFGCVKMKISEDE